MFICFLHNSLCFPLSPSPPSLRPHPLVPSLPPPHTSAVHTSDIHLPVLWQEFFVGVSLGTQVRHGHFAPTRRAYTSHVLSTQQPCIVCSGMKLPMLHVVGVLLCIRACHALQGTKQTFSDFLCIHCSGMFVPRFGQAHISILLISLHPSCFLFH